jgi:hypothetical protein
MSQLILSALIWAFSFWMVADSIRRRRSLGWVMVILLMRPYGGLIYLVWRKVSESPRGRALLGKAAPSLVSPVGSAPRASIGASPPSLDAADQLEEQLRFSEAAAIYRQVIGQDAMNARALHGLARCLVELHQPDDALQKYEALMAVDPRFRNYSAALEYAEALHQSGRAADAIELLEGLVQETGRLNHRLALAHYCQVAGQTARARGVLSEALAAYDSSPAPEQEANRHWQRRIADKLAELATG